MHQTLRVLIAVSAAGLATGSGACSSSTSPSAQQMTLSFSSQSPVAAGSASSRGPNFSITVASGANTVVITKAQIVARKFELKSVSGGSCPETDIRGDSCEEMKLGPMLVDLPLGAGTTTTTPLPISVPAGTYRELEMQIHRPVSNPLDVAFTLANPLFAGISIRVEGTFNGTPFVFTSPLTAELELAFSPAITVAATGGNITVQIDVASWFKTAAGAVIDPATANAGGVNENTVRETIKRSFHALDDSNRDGK